MRLFKFDKKLSIRYFDCLVVLVLTRRFCSRINYCRKYKNEAPSDSPSPSLKRKLMVIENRSPYIKIYGRPVFKGAFVLAYNARVNSENRMRLFHFAVTVV